MPSPSLPRLATLPERGDCDHQPFWCEENIGRLLARPELAGRDSWALIISNPARRVSMLRQRAGHWPLGAISWDYHVVAIVASAEGGERLILDLDTLLDFPLPGRLWLDRSFPDRPEAGREARFRLLTGRDYLENLASDRSHMLAPDGSWQASPPPWPPFGQGRAPNLLAWIDLGRPEPGWILDIPELRSFLAGSPLPEGGPS
jgi:hypothetical protein